MRLTHIVLGSLVMVVATGCGTPRHLGGERPDAARADGEAAAHVCASDGGVDYRTVQAGTFKGGLWGAWGSGPRDVWLVGLEGTLVHWDGATFTRVPQGTEAYLGVWGSGVDDVWIVGSTTPYLQTSKGLILHRDGQEWTRTETSLMPFLNRVWSTSPGSVWVAGYEGVIHWDGITWSKVYSRTGDQLWGIWGSAANDVWVVGTTGTEAGPGAAVILHWDGRTWTESWRSTVENTNLIAIQGTGPDDVWAVGGGGSNATPGLILHWDGHAWNPVENDPGRVLISLWVSTPRDAWAGGYGGKLLHWDGSAWTHAEPGLWGDNSLLGFWGNQPDDVWVVGDLLAHWDGCAWTRYSAQRDAGPPTVVDGGL